MTTWHMTLVVCSSRALNGGVSARPPAAACTQATPATGLYTAVAAGFVVSALGGSRVAIGGPTAAFIPIVVGVSHEYGPENLVYCTLLAGLMLIAMGMLRLGAIITAIPRPVISGFTAGIAVFIFSTQMKDFLGLHLHAGDGPVPAEFLPKVGFILQHLGQVHAPSLALAAASLAVVLAWPAEWKKTVPSQIVAVAFGLAVIGGMQAAGEQ